MKFNKKNRDYRDSFSTLVYILYEKITLEVISKINSFFGMNEKTIKLSLVEYCGFRMFDENLFDDLHINYLNERVFLHYAQSLISYEKLLYEEEGLGSHFPKGFKF